MLNLAQVYVGVRTSGISQISLIAFSYIGLAVIYLVLMVIWLVPRKNTLTYSALIIYIIQGVLAPILMSTSGIILMIQGWRLDPTIQFQQLLLLVLIVYLSFKDIIINFIRQIR